MKFELLFRATDNFSGSDEYPTENISEKRREITTREHPFCEIFASAFIEDVVKLLDEKEVDALSSLCRAIQSLGEQVDQDGFATVYMGPLYDAACDYLGCASPSENSPESGSFTVHDNEKTSPPLPYDADETQIQNAIDHMNGK